jgi:hypothetical protein
MLKLVTYLNRLRKNPCSIQKKKKKAAQEIPGKFRDEESKSFTLVQSRKKKKKAAQEIPGKFRDEEPFEEK